MGPDEAQSPWCSVEPADEPGMLVGGEHGTQMVIGTRLQVSIPFSESKLGSRWVSMKGGIDEKW